MSAFTIHVNEADKQQIRQMFAGLEKSGTRATVRAINKTLTGVKTDASAEIRAVVTAKKKAVDETFKISKATEASPKASIASTGKPLALIDYSIRETARGVSVQVRKDRPRKIVPSAFIAQMKSGHKGAYWRTWHDKTSRPVKKMTEADRKKMANLPKQFRLPIVERFGPRIPDIMSNDSVMMSVLGKADERLHKNLLHEAEYELSKLK